MNIYEKLFKSKYIALSLQLLQYLFIIKTLLKFVKIKYLNIKINTYFSQTL